MGLINAKVIEKLAKTFLHAQPRFCGHILPLGASIVSSFRYRRSPLFGFWISVATRFSHDGRFGHPKAICDRFATLGEIA